MRQTVISTLLISIFVLGASSCDKKVDGIRCVTIKDDNNQLYLRCRNSKKEKSFNADLSIIGKCLRHQESECTWILTDENEYEKFKSHYEEQCQK